MNNEDILIKAKKDLPILKGFAERIIKFADRALNYDIRFDKIDSFAIMSIWFLNKQLEHYKSILLLTKNNFGRDAGLIVRSMFEGLTQLLYANRNPKEMSEKWLKYLFIQRWRTLKTYKSINQEVPLKVEKEINYFIDKYGNEFLLKKTGKGKPLQNL